MHPSVMKIFRDIFEGWEDWTSHREVHDHKDWHARLRHDKENKTRTGKY